MHFFSKSSPASITPQAHELCFLPLGGCGEIGMNFNLYGHDDQWLIVDCGVTFKKRAEGDELTASLNNEVYAADPGFISDKKEKIAGMILTHAHEDHLGAVPYLWPRLQCPIYTTAFTAEVLRRKLVQFDLVDKVPVHTVLSGDTKAIGKFNVEWLALTHSLPEAQALVIRTPAGKVFHTGDWKIDNAPVVGKGFQKQLFKQLAAEKIDAMVCDSTNATVAGWSTSESELYQGLAKAVAQTKGRAIVTCFGSNIARLRQLAKIALEQGRHFGVLGRSLQNMISVARACGYWPAEYKVIDSTHLGYLPANEVLAAATGSQGEPRTALFRLATDDHFDMDLQADDRVIFSSRVIPGNELWVDQLIEKLKLKRVGIVNNDSQDLPIHASGHPCEDELRCLYQWVQPALAIPVHGEERHMRANANIARHAGVARQLTGNNGDLFYLSPTPRVRRAMAKSGQICVSR